MLQRQALSQRDTIMISFGVIQNQFFRCFLQGEPRTLPFSGSRTGVLGGGVANGYRNVVQFNTARSGIQRAVSRAQMTWGN